MKKIIVLALILSAVLIAGKRMGEKAYADMNRPATVEVVK